MKSVKIQRGRETWVYDGRGACDSCDKENALLTYDEDIGIYRCQECTRRMWRLHKKAMRENYEYRKALGEGRI